MYEHQSILIMHPWKLGRRTKETMEPRQTLGMWPRSRDQSRGVRVKSILCAMVAVGLDLQWLHGLRASKTGRVSSDQYLALRFWNHSSHEATEQLTSGQTWHRGFTRQQQTVSKTLTPGMWSRPRDHYLALRVLRPCKPCDHGTEDGLETASCFLNPYPSRVVWTPDNNQTLPVLEPLKPWNN